MDINNQNQDPNATSDGTQAEDDNLFNTIAAALADIENRVKVENKPNAPNLQKPAVGKVRRPRMASSKDEEDWFCRRAQIQKKSFNFGKAMGSILKEYEESRKVLKNSLRRAMNDPCVTQTTPGWEMTGVSNLKKVLTIMEDVDSSYVRFCLEDALDSVRNDVTLGAEKD